MLGSTLARGAKQALLHLLGTAGTKAEALSPELEARLREEFTPTYAYLQDLGFEVYDET